jgi:serine/threonine protein kinase
MPNPDELDLPDLHPNVELKDLNANGKLFTDEEIIEIKLSLANQPDGRLIKEKTGRRFDLIKLEGALYAVYEGADGKSKALGDGAQGKVELAQNVQTGLWFAVKVGTGATIYSEEDIEKAKKDMEQEHKILKHIGRATGTMFAHEKMFSKAKRPRDIDDVRVQFHSMMELTSGCNIEEFLQKRRGSPPLSATHWLDITLGLLLSVKNFQAMGFLHRDIKLDNFMFDSFRHQVSLIDFGAAKAMDSKGEVTGDLIGTPGYIAPEIKGTHITYNEKSEVYALGVLLKQILGFSLIPNRRGEDFFNPTVFQHDAHMRAFLESMTSSAPAKRPSLEKAMRFFALARQELLHLSHASVGVLNIQDYAMADEKQKAAFVAALKQVDEVKLVSSDQKAIPDLKLIALKRELSEAGLNLSNPNKDNSTVIRSYFKFSSHETKDSDLPQIIVSHDDGLIYRKQIDEHLSKESITPEHHKHVLDTLRAERDRLKKDYSLDDKNVDSNKKSIMIARGRVELLNRAIKNMEGPDNRTRMTYNGLSNTLRVLESRMIGTNVVSRWLGLKSESRQKIEALRTVLPQADDQNSTPRFKK